MSTAHQPVRVALVEDHALFAESLELALTVEGYDVRRVTVPEKEQAPGALITAITRRRPRVVLLLSLIHI